MKKAHKVILYFFIAVFIAFSFLLSFYISKKNEQNIILYYGITCPHCKNVDEFIENNGIEAKVKITRREIYTNQFNLNELQRHALECGINQSTVGVPFIYYQGNCYLGEDECIDFLKNITEMI